MMTFPKNAGIAGGLMGGMTYVITSLTSFVITSTGKVDSQIALSWRYLIFSIVLFMIIIVLSRISSKRKHNMV